MRHRHEAIYPRGRWQHPKPRTLDWVSPQTRPFQWEIKSWICQEDLTKKWGTYPAGNLVAKYFQEDSCSCGTPGAKVSVRLRGHPLHFLRAELARGCLGVGPHCCEGPEVGKTLASQRMPPAQWHAVETGGEQAVPGQTLPAPESPRKADE